MTALLLPAAVCARLHVSPTTLKRMEAQGLLTPVRIGTGRGRRMYREQDVETYIEQRTQARGRVVTRGAALEALADRLVAGCR